MIGNLKEKMLIVEDPLFKMGQNCPKKSFY